MDRLTVLGIRAPAHFPIVFSWASVAALLWFWWRYHVAWLSSSAGLTFRSTYLRELHQKEPFKAFVAKHVNHEKITKSYSERTRQHLPTDATYLGHHETGNPTWRRLLICVQLLKYNSGKTNYDVGTTDFPGEREIELRVPWWFHCIHSPGFFLRRAFRDESFADQILPQIVFGVAVFLIACKAVGVDPAGIFGLLSITEPTRGVRFRITGV